MDRINIIPPYDIKEIKLNDYSIKTRKTILSNLKKYIKLKKLFCFGYNLNELLDLPISLEYLNCSCNNLTELPELPNSLIELYCYDNKLIKLPNLTNSLKVLLKNLNSILFF